MLCSGVHFFGGIGWVRVLFFFSSRVALVSMLPFVGWCTMMMLLLVWCVVNEGIVLLRHQLSV